MAAKGILKLDMVANKLGDLEKKIVNDIRLAVVPNTKLC